MENLFKLIDELIVYEKKMGIKFDEKGYPIFEKEMFVHENFHNVIPFDHRNEASANDLICFYSHDICMYRKLTFKKLNFVAKELNKHLGFIGFDLSLFTDTPILTEKFYLLANLVIDIFFILSGNLMVPNLRKSKIDYFNIFKNAPILSCGTLGCSKAKNLKNKNIILIKNYAKENENKKIIEYGSKLVEAKNIIHIKAYKKKGENNG